jgi:predicted transposase YdaD
MTDNDQAAPASDHDSPWKEALEHYFPDFLALLFPHIHAEIDWSHGHDFLDKELQQIVRDAQTGRRYADKLVSVHRRDGSPAWVLVHVEVQGDPEAAFAERMFVYNHRLRDARGVPVASLAVLADTSPRFRPTRYKDGLWGCSIEFRFPVAKLLDWDRPKRWAKLERSDNPFALVVMAQLRAKDRSNVEQRRAWKLKLIRLMYDRGYDRGTILELFRVIDWMIRLPAEAEAAFRQDLHDFETSRQMPYITTVERAGIKKGLRRGLQRGRQQGLQQGLQQGEAAALLWLIEKKFGADVAEHCQGRIKAAGSEDLRRWSERILTAESIAQVLD